MWKSLLQAFLANPTPLTALFVVILVILWQNIHFNSKVLSLFSKSQELYSRLSSNLAQDRTNQEMNDKILSLLETALTDISQNMIKLSTNQDRIANTLDVLTKEQAALRRDISSIRGEIDDLKLNIRHDN